MAQWVTWPSQSAHHTPRPPDTNTHIPSHTQTQRHTQTEHRYTQTHRSSQTHTHIHMHTPKHTQTHKDPHRHTYTHTHSYRYPQTRTQTIKHTLSHTHTHARTAIMIDSVVLGHIPLDEITRNRSRLFKQIMRSLLCQMEGRKREALSLLQVPETLRQPTFRDGPRGKERDLGDIVESWIRT